MEINPLYMARALQLARNGEGHVSPNPMVGAVIVHDGKIIGEGWHRIYGQGHAEVNAVASVADKSLLRDSTMYVTLEPCSHYGKTPPCSKLIIESGIPRVVVATLDPFEKVSGRGVAMLRDAGVEVVTGVMEQESRHLNKRFITAHTERRPYVMLKWAQSADGFLDRRRTPAESPAIFSTPLSSQAVHQLRGRFDAIMVGSGTVAMDNPSLDVRHIDGLRSPRRIVADRSGRLSPDTKVFRDDNVIYFGPQRDDINATIIDTATSMEEMLRELYAEGITSLLVEGGATLLKAFISAGLWDECRVEISPTPLGEEGAYHMTIPQAANTSTEKIGPNAIVTIRR